MSKIQTIRTLWLFTALLLAPTFSTADSLQVSFPTIVSDNLPQTTERIIRALESTGMEIDINYLPNKRSLAMLRKGKIALEFIRIRSVMSQYPELIRLQPPIQFLKFKMITSAKTPEICNKNESEYRNLSFAGVIGVNLHQAYFYPKFDTQTTISGVEETAKFIVLQRADVSFFPDEVLATIPEE